MTDYAISSGVTTGFTLSSGDSLTVSSGGVSSESLIGANSLEWVSSGGVSSESRISSAGYEYVFSSGLSVSETVLAGGLMAVSGGEADAATVFGKLTVEGDVTVGVVNRRPVTNYTGSGVGSGTVISSGGVVVAEYGGDAVSATVSAGGTLLVSSRGAASAVTVASGGVLSSIGGVYDSTILGGGSANVADVYISSGQALALTKFGAAQAADIGGLEVESGGYVTFSAASIDGVLSLAAGVDLKATVSIASGGALEGAGTLVGGAEVTVFSYDDGAVSGVELLDHMVMQVSSAAVADGVRLAADADLLVLSGGSASGVLVSGGDLDVAAGASATGTIVRGDPYYYSAVEVYGSTVGDQVSGGGEVVFSRGVASGAVIYSDGLLSASSGGAVVSATLSGGYLWLASGASATSTTIDAGELELIAGASALAVLINGGDMLVESGASVGGVIVSQGDLTVSGSASADQVSNGGEVIADHGVATSDVILSGGQLSVDGGGRETSFAISSGAELQVASGAHAVSGTVLDGGVAIVFAGAGVSATSVLSGGLLEIPDVVISAGVTSATSVVTTVTDRLGLRLSSGASIGFEGLTVSSGGTLLLHAGGVATAVSIYSGSVLGPGDLDGQDFGGLVSGADITGEFLDEGLVENVRVGGGAGHGDLDVATVAYNIHLSTGQVVVGPPDLALVPTAVVSAAYISGGEMIVSANGAASAVFVSSGGEMLLDGGVGSAVSVYAGGEVVGSGVLLGSLEGSIADHGLVSGASLASGAQMTVYAAAAAGLIRTNSGAQVAIQAGASASDVTTVFGGLMSDDGIVSYTVSNVLGGTLSGDGELIQKGKGLLEISGAAGGFDGFAVISGGTLELATSGGLGAAEIKFDTATSLVTTLELLAAAQPKDGGVFLETLFNFDKPVEAVDLRKQAFVSGATATLSGHTLTLVDGGYTASFTLSGSTASSYASGYTVASDGHGGTEIIAAPPTPGALAHFMAAFGAPGVAALITASSGGGAGILGAIFAHSAGAASPA